jgi:hypothetical protein
MDSEAPQPIWRFRLMVGTGLAIYLLVLLVHRAGTRRAAVEEARQEFVDELLRLRDAQDRFFRRTGGYAGREDPRLGYTPPPALLFALHADGARGWRAVVADSSLPVPPRACGVFVGDPALAPNRASVRPGEPACW